MDRPSPPRPPRPTPTPTVPLTREQPNFLTQLAPFLGVSQYEPGDSYWDKVSSNWASNPLNPVPQISRAVSENRTPTREEVGTDAGWLAAGLLPVGKAASQLNAIVNKLNKSTDVSDFISPETLRYAGRPNEAMEGLYRPGSPKGGFNYESVPEADSPYLFGLVPTERLSPLREFDRATEPAGLGYSGPDNIKKLLDHILSGGKLRDPLQISWEPGSNWSYLAEGNHRLALAEMLGLEQLPTTVFRTRGVEEIMAPQRIGGPMDIDLNVLHKTDPRLGGHYIPPQMNPHLFPYLRPDNSVSMDAMMEAIGRRLDTFQPPRVPADSATYSPPYRTQFGERKQVPPTKR